MLFSLRSVQTKGFYFILSMCLLLTLTVQTAKAQMNEKLSFSGDFRSRIELDRSSDNSDGTTRDDRDRMRIRARFGLTYTFSERVSFGMRLRTGNPESAQSPHLTLGDEMSPLPIQLDKAFAQVRFSGGSAWFGKNSNPFWHQNEMFWDDDVTMEGLSGTYNIGDQLDIRAGYFILDSPNSNTFSDQASMLGGQLVYSSGPITGAVGVEKVRENSSVDDLKLGDLDYLFLKASLFGTFSIGKQDARLGVDVSSNMETYDDALFNHDQTLGYVLSARIGKSSSAGDWQFEYFYAHIEKYAVIGAFAQDDWLRWGSATTTRSSNFAGHEGRVVYTLGPKQNLMARLFTVEGIAKEKASSMTLETGTRFRIDWNIGF